MSYFISQADKSEIERLYDSERYGYIMIARKIGRSESAVRSYLRKSGRRGMRPRKGMPGYTKDAEP